jgi:membrane protease YdiL (CAAX protease family)
MSKTIIIVAALILILHGLIHLIGTTIYMKLGTVEGLSCKTTLLGGRWDVGEGGIWMFGALWVVPLSFAFTWVYNNTHRSILAVILFHGMVNFTGELFDISAQANIYATALWVVAALGITIFWGADTFTRQPRQEAWA